jgi:hypothetical protein
VRRAARLLLATALALGCSRSVDAVVALDCAPGSDDPSCAPTPWPTDGHSANSDPWMVTHHQVITQMRPKVLVLNFENGASTSDAMATAHLQAAAIAEGSRPHGYDDGSATPFLQPQIVAVVDLTDHPPPASWPNPSSTQLPTTTMGEFDPTALFTARFSDAYGFPDPASPARSLSLCEMFEDGVVNEVWIEDGEAGVRRAPLNVERKQVYDDAGRPIAGTFRPDVGGGGSLDVACGVTVRMAHLDRARGPGCDLQVRGWGIEGMWEALPAPDAADARAFLNGDFNSRFGVQFHSFAEICDQAGDPCVGYPDAMTAAGSYPDGSPWRISPFTQGCGTSRFPPNARARGDFTNAAAVDSRCEGFGLAGGPGGADSYAPYSSATVAGQDAAFPDCGGGWQIYWRQSMPGPNTHAHGANGRPLKNWWPFLYY